MRQNHSVKLCILALFAGLAFSMYSAEHTPEMPNANNTRNTNRTAASSGEYAERLSVTVRHVIDGDSLIIVQPNGEEHTVRLYGVDAPEGRQRYGTHAASFTKTLTLGKTLEWEELYLDQYGRSVALLYVDTGESVNELLVGAGQAWVYRQHCKRPECSDWIKAEQQAQKNRQGLWKDKNPLPPWKWRKKNARSGD